MQELFRGYLPTKNKQPQIAYDKAQPLSKVANKPEYAGLLAENVILIDIDNYDDSEIFMDIVDDLQLNCRVIATDRGKHFYFYGGNIEKGGNSLTLPLGIKADIKVGNHNSIGMLKMNRVVREIIYDIQPHEEYQAAPDWLKPIKANIDFKKLGEGDGRNQTFFNYILTLQNAGIKNDDIKQCITLINKYILPEPLPDDELVKILRDEAFQKPNFNDENGKFQFNKFAEFLKNNDNIIKLDGQLHIYSDGIYKEGLIHIERQMIKYIPTLKDRQRKEIIKYLELIAPDIKDVSGANYIAFKNGIYNLDTGELENFNPEIVIRNKIPHNYNSEVYSDVMDTVLNRISCQDSDIRALLEEVAGYCFYRRNELRKAFIFIGDKANGKSTYMDCLVRMVGEENSTALDLSELGDRFKTAELYNKLICAGDDIGDEFIPNPAIFKKVVSGDPITAEQKNQNPFKLYNYAKTIFSANNIPRIKDKTGAVKDRLIIVPFNANFSKDSDDYDPYIKYKLRTEEAMEYLIILAIEGLKRVLNNQAFTISAKVQAELDEYNEQNNPIIGFIKEIDVDVDILNQPTKDVYLRYKVYCSEGGFTPMSHNEFTKYIKKELELDNTVARLKGKLIRIFRKAGVN